MHQRRRSCLGGIFPEYGSIAIKLLNHRYPSFKSQASRKYWAATFLANHAVSLRVDGKYQLQHQKIMVVDGVSVETGSYNFTASARDKNSENVIIIRNVPDLAGRYEANWEKMWKESVLLESSN